MASICVYLAPRDLRGPCWSADNAFVLNNAKTQMLARRFFKVLMQKHEWHQNTQEVVRFPSYNKHFKDKIKISQPRSYLEKNKQKQNYSPLSIALCLRLTTNTRCFSFLLMLRWTVCLKPKNKSPRHGEQKWHIRMLFVRSQNDESQVSMFLPLKSGARKKNQGMNDGLFSCLVLVGKNSSR